MSESTTAEMVEENRLIVDKYIDWIKGKRAESTVDLRRSHLNNFLNWCEHNDVRAIDLDKWQFEDYIDTRLSDGLSKKYVLGLYDSVSQLYQQWLLGERKRLKKKHGIEVPIEENPTEGVREDYKTLTEEPLKSELAHEDIVALSEEEAAKLVKVEHMPNPKAAMNCC